MLKLLEDSLETYFQAARIIFIFGFLVFAILLFLMSFSTYVVAGAGFIRYASLLGGDFSFPQLIVFGVIGLISLFCLAFLSVGVTMVVKFKRSLDDLEFARFVARFPKYVFRLTGWWVILGIITLGIGVFFSALSFNPVVMNALTGFSHQVLGEETGIVLTPNFFSALAMLLVWAFFLFLPQSLVLHEKKFFPSLKDSAEYCFRRPGAVLFYYVLSCFLLFLLLVIDLLFGYVFLFGVSAVINSALLFMVFIPLLEIIKANLFVTRYRLLLSGLK